MANVNGILAILGAAFAALSAIVLLEAALFLPGLLALGVGIYVALRQRDEMPVLIAGALAILLGLVTILSLAVNILPTLTNAFAVAACIAVAATALAKHWDDTGSPWNAVSAGALVIAAILGFVFAGDLTNQQTWQPYVVAVLALGGLYPAIVALKS